MNDLWGKLRFFSRNEKWGDPDKMDPDFVVQLDNFRGVIGFPFHVLSGYSSSGHAENSYHYKGRAVDGRFIRPGSRESLSLAEHVLIAIRAPFGGVGIYTWGSGGPFLHLDDRLATHDRKVWISRSEGKYENISIEFIREALSSQSKLIG